ncbi:hypothetical protein [Fluviispira multicolorata]|uniref:Uncharacterized protein n=1 Tax=Fluviispira multicolorata TaxID=2654512 RepID=A0A833JET2_9BACT|nr:hypothetical protein [Fluviispira multicolorata]KAB8032237.1 hypothetical protein GCL57_06205 [Fluviispira multicolorata]
MKKIISCFAASLLFSVANFAFAEQTSNLLPNELSNDSYSLPTVLSTAVIENKVNPSSSGNSITLINHSNRIACVTVVDANPLKSKGWYILANGATGTYHSLSYFRAEECGTAGGVYWNPGWDMQYFCLNYNTAFNIYTPGNSAMCTNLGGQMKPYYRLPGDVTLTLLY